MLFFLQIIVLLIASGISISTQKRDSEVEPDGDSVSDAYPCISAYEYLRADVVDTVVACNEREKAAVTALRNDMCIERDVRSQTNLWIYTHATSRVSRSFG